MSEIDELLAPSQQASPAPATTDWVPMWNLGAPPSPVIGAMQVIADQRLSAAGTTLCDFTSIPQGFAHLLLVIGGLRGSAGSAAQLSCMVNGDAVAANYMPCIRLHAAGGAVATDSLAASTAGGLIVGDYTSSTDPANRWTSAECWINDYANASFGHIFKTSSFQPASQRIMQSASGYYPLAAINRLTLTAATALAAGARATLYGVGATNLSVAPALNTGMALVASTVSGLGAGVDGQLGLIETPSETILLTYRQSLGRWLGDPIYAGRSGPTNAGGGWVRVSPEFEYRCDELIAAGLKLQVRAFVEGRDSSNSQNYTASARVVRYSTTGGSFVLFTNPNGVQVVNPVTLPSISYGASAGLELPWADVPNLAASTVAKVQVEGSNQSSGQGNADYYAALWVRYSS